MFSQLLVTLLISGTAYSSPVRDHSLARREIFPRGDGEDVKPPTLKPSVKWDRRRDDWEDLIPKTAQQLYFGSNDPLEQHQFAEMAVNFTGRAIVLDYSEFVKDVKCSETAIDITFSKKTAFEYAKNAWDEIRDFMIVTNSDTCGALVEQFSFWDVSDLHYDAKSLNIHADVTKEHSIGDVLDYVNVAWGTWIPDAHTKRAYQDLNQRDLHKRNRAKEFFKKTVKRVWDGAKKAVMGTPVAKVISVGIKVNPIRLGIKAFQAIKNWNPDIKDTIPIDIRPDQKPDPSVQQWANAVEIAKVQKGTVYKNVQLEGNLALYCVDCHFTGSIQLHGRAEYSVGSGLTGLWTQADGEFQAQFALGLIAEAKASYEYEKLLFTKVIPKTGFVIENIMVLGVFVNARAKAEVDVKIKGSALAGVKMTECKVSSRLDFKNLANSSPLKVEPKFEPFFKADVEIEANAGISFPLQVGLGLQIYALGPAGDFSVSMVEQPGLNARATYSASTGNEEGEGEGEGGGEGEGEGEEGGEGEEEPTVVDKAKLKRKRNAVGRVVSRQDTPTCKGIDWDIKFRNILYLDAFKKYQHTLHDYISPDIAGGCIPIGKQPEAETPGNENDKRGLPLIAARDEVWDEEDYDSVNQGLGDFDEADYASFDQLADEAIAAIEADSIDPESYPEGTNFITIKDSTNSYQIQQNDRGWLGPGAATAEAVPGGVWAEDDGIVFADYLERSLRHTSLAMRWTGVSDISLFKRGDLPRESEFIALVPGWTGDAEMPWVYVAEDIKGNMYTIVTCNYRNADSRLWIVRDLKKGIATLKRSPALLVGGRITECYPQAWTVGPGDVDEWATLPE